nr:hypothetical protein [Tanacetum cinerariifolium]
FAVSGFARAIQNQLGNRRCVQDGLGPGRAAQAGHTTGCSRAGFRSDTAFAAIARLAQRHVQIDQPRCCHQSCADLSGFQVNVDDLIQTADRVDDASVDDAELHCAFSCSNWRCAVWPLMAMDKTAMRTAMP